ncbi:MAG: crosslink repair DNA glycosylase YcaQ family protein, partial [Planctomycetota bacterium]|nr:crosslink repair DNA glycosylase YcaQ family protein [Planctomycetota bacterium]
MQQVLNEEQMADLLDSRAIERVELRLLHRSEASRARSPDELASAIRDLGDPPASVSALQELVDGDAAAMLGQLLKDGRIVACEVPDVEMNPIRLVSADLWREYHEAFTPTRRGKKLQVILPRLENGEFAGFDAAPADKHIPARWRRKVSVDEARLSVIERYLKCRGPVTLYELANHTGWPAGTVERILSKLVDAGSVAQGVYRSDKPRPQWVNKANLEGIHQLTLGYLKRELAACAPYEVVDFMIRWQHLHPTTRLEGLDGLRQVIRQLQGFELLIGAIEPEMLAGRIRDYSPQMLERLIASGEVSWQRVGDGVKRGRATLCFRKDATWLGAAVDRKYDVLKGADADIANVIADVRAFFSDNPIAFFDEAMEATGHDEGAVMRAVWYLAWCGEMTCDSYECVRHSDFQSTLSGCYDLYSTPDRIVTGKIAAEDVVERMKRRKLDPRLGRWSATELLSGDSSKGRMGVPPVMTGETPEVIQHWTQQLLQRWGILSREFLIAEAAAPTWQQLVPELKRLELLGKVNRGFFIESHHGEQYGLPEAIELLRECRARRSDGKELGYLPDEAVFCITNRDPANLYTRSLDIIEERGSHLQRSMKAGNVYHRMVIQAGQVLLFQGGTDVRQLVTLSRKQLDVCVGALMHDFDGSDVALNIGRWNGYPVDVSPVSKLLHRLGFRFDKPDRMTCPAPGRPLDVPLARPEQAAFLPYYEEPSPIQVGPDWTLSRASDAVRPVLQQFVPIMTKQLERPGWELTWNLH